MKPAIRQRALALGFDACGFTTVSPPESATRFQDWLAQGRHGDMAYLQRNAHKRVDPQKVLPGARSVITVIASYEVQSPKNDVQSPKSKVQGPGVSDEMENNLAPPELPVTHRQLPVTHHESTFDPHPSTGNPRPTSVGLIARYARFDDYHDVLGERLKTLAAFLDEQGGEGVRSLWYVDTGPFLERDLAQRAGVGFIGKHTNLISRRLGNWIFLGEIITTLALEPDVPEKNRCGSCARCIAACPTQAITGPFQLDARLCISYLTIELKGPIPVDLRPAIGQRIFGCDDCLAVCPWNRFAREGNLMKNHVRMDLQQPGLLELLALDEPNFKRRFSGTPIARAKRRGLLRNVCVALGNAGDARALPGLALASHDPEPLIAEHARWAIHRIEGGLPCG